MKILLLGEFSGVHTNLKKGLSALGHQVTLANNGDAFKGFQKDVQICPFKSRFFGKLLNIFFFFFNIRKYIGYDVVQFISPFALPYYFYFVGIHYIIFRFNKQTIYYVCGTDPAYMGTKEMFDYFPFDDSNPAEHPNFTRTAKQKPYRYFLQKVHKIIPSTYAYAFGYENNKKIQKYIPLPGSGEYITRIKPVNSKIKILFGITRKGFKGADFILEALGRVKEKHGNEVEIKIVERLPFVEYTKLLEDCDILIDQCKSYDYGMNAIFAMEKGCVVLSGSEKIAMDYLGIENPAVINIRPDKGQIEEALFALIKNKKQLCLLKERSLEQVRQIHDPRVIAVSFVENYK